MQKRDPVEAAKGLVKRFSESLDILDRPMRTREQVEGDIAHAKYMKAAAWVSRGQAQWTQRISELRAELARIEKGTRDE